MLHSGASDSPSFQDISLGIVGVIFVLFPDLTEEVIAHKKVSCWTSVPSFVSKLILLFADPTGCVRCLLWCHQTLSSMWRCEVVQKCWQSKLYFCPKLPRGPHDAMPFSYWSYAACSVVVALVSGLMPPVQLCDCILAWLVHVGCSHPLALLCSLSSILGDLWIEKFMSLPKNSAETDIIDDTVDQVGGTFLVRQDLPAAPLLLQTHGWHNKKGAIKNLFSLLPLERMIEPPSPSAQTLAQTQKSIPSQPAVSSWLTQEYIQHCTVKCQWGQWHKHANHGSVPQPSR